METCFADRIPSVFLVSSPFQGMCAIAAIRQLQITDYDFYAVLYEDSPRNKQITSLLTQFDVEFKIIRYQGGVRILNEWLKSLVPKQRNYKRLFVGDLRNIYGLLKGCQFVSNNSDVVYLDDGNFTVSLLDNTYCFGKMFRTINKSLSISRGITTCKNLLTIFDDMPNGNYYTARLNLNTLLSHDNQEDNILKNVVLVGTNSVAYCNELNIDKMVFYSIFEKFLIELRREYSAESIIFVPHGRDNSNEIKALCRKYSVDYRPANIMIELELLCNEFQPKAVYGYTSTALFTIKKIFKRTKVFNLVIECDKQNVYYQQYLSCSDYYEKHDIRTLLLK